MSDKKAGKRDIVHRLYEKAAMICLGEKIEFGSETKLMWEAADEIERLRSALAAARPHILEEAAKCLEGIADAMEEKAEAIRAQSEPFDPATSDERDAAVTAFEFRRAAAAIRAVKEGE